MPNWPTQPWFSKAMQLLTQVPIILPRERTILQLPWDLNLVHPLHNQMSLLACRISGNPIRCKEFLQQQPTLLLAPGDPAPVNYIEATLADGIRHSVRPGYKSPIVKLPAFPENQDLCVVSTLTEYLRRTEPIRGEHKQLLLSHTKPHKPVSVDTISWWIKLVLSNSGIDTKHFN